MPGPGQGVSSNGPDGLLKQLSKMVLETTLYRELTRAPGPAC